MQTKNILTSLKTFCKTKLFFLTVLFVVVFVLYGKSINFDFVNLDEDTLIEKNIAYLSNIKNVPKLFLTSCYFTKTSFYYRPILSASFCLETSLFGFNKKVYHFTNIILFILSLYLMYVFLLKLNINNNISKYVILLFAVHPVFTTLPVWVPARNDTLLIIFILLSFIGLANYIQSDKKIHLIWFVLFFVLALFTKESAIFLFILYPLFLYCFKYKFVKKYTYIYISLLIPIIVYLFLRSCSVASINITSYFADSLKYLSNLVFGLCNYIFFFFVPYKLPAMLLNETIQYKTLTVFCLVTLICVGFYYKNVKHRKILLFSAVWFLIFIIPTFFQKEYVFLNHRLFISSVGLLMFLSIFVEELMLKFHILKKVMFILFVILFGCLFYLSFTFQNTFSNRQPFWQQAYTDAPNYHFVPYNLAVIYYQQGNYEKYKEFIFKAYKSKNGKIHFFNVAPILMKEGQTDKVKQICFDILQNEKSKLFFKTGANIVLGQICLQENNLKQAYKYFKTALELDNMNLVLKNRVEWLKSQITEN